MVDIGSNLRRPSSFSSSSWSSASFSLHHLTLSSSHPLILSSFICDCYWYSGHLNCTAGCKKHQHSDSEPLMCAIPPRESPAGCWTMIIDIWLFSNRDGSNPTIPGWWWLEHEFYFPFHIWDNPSHWLIFFKMVKTINQILSWGWTCILPASLEIIVIPGFWAIPFYRPITKVGSPRSVVRGVWQQLQCLSKSLFLKIEPTKNWI